MSAARAQVPVSLTLANHHFESRPFDAVGTSNQIGHKDLPCFLYSVEQEAGDVHPAAQWVFDRRPNQGRNPRCVHLAQFPPAFLVGGRFGGRCGLPLKAMFFFFQQVVEFNNKGVEFLRVLLGSDLGRQLQQSFPFLALHSTLSRPNLSEFGWRQI
jgi:hypothetical protein